MGRNRAQPRNKGDADLFLSLDLATRAAVPGRDRNRIRKNKQLKFVRRRPAWGRGFLRLKLFARWVPRPVSVAGARRGWNGRDRLEIGYNSTMPISSIVAIAILVVAPVVVYSRLRDEVASFLIAAPIAVVALVANMAYLETHSPDGDPDFIFALACLVGSGVIVVANAVLFGSAYAIRSVSKKSILK